jgi:WD40 repeat protein
MHVDASLRDEAIAAFALPDVRRGPSWQVSRTNCLALTCDAMGQRYAMLDRAGALVVRRIEDNHELQRLEIQHPCSDCFTRLAFSPDGRFLVKVAEVQPPLLWSLENGEAVLLNAPEGGSSPTFSADSRFLALAAGDEVYRFDLATGRQVNRWKTAGHIHALQFHPSDHRIAVSYKEGPWISVYDAADGRELAQLEVGVGWRMVVSWHPDGRHLAVGSTSLGIQIWDAEAQRSVASLVSHAPEVDFLTFHPSGNWLASWTWDGVMDLWEPATGRQAMQIPLTAELQFSRDGRWLGFFWSSEERAQLLELVLPQDYFTLQDDSRAGRKTYNACSVSPDDRWLAVAMEDGVQVWDLAGRRKVALLPAGENQTVVFEADGRALWTCAADLGLQRWPCDQLGANGSEPRLGPPQRIELPIAPTRVVSDGATRTLAIISKATGQAVVVDLTNRSPRRVAFEHPVADFIALSPDAKWLATSGWHSERCRLWNTESGELVKDWVVGVETRVGFSPDSRELVVARGSEFHFLSIDTLATSRRLKREIGLYPGNVAFSPDGKLMAMEMAPAVIHLKEASTGRTVAQLEDPFGDRSSMLSFSHEGTRLIVLSSYASAIHVWNLRGIRSRLKEIGLDWDWPEFTTRPKE